MSDVGAKKRGCDDTCVLRRRLGRECGVWAAFGVSVGGANKRGFGDTCGLRRTFGRLWCVGSVWSERWRCKQKRS